MPIRILLVDDHRVMRQGIRALLEREPDMDVVGEAGDGDQAVRLAAELHPDVVILDVSMPSLSGIEAARQIASKQPDVRILALSMHPSADFISEMLKAGAAGYLLKNCAFDELVRAIHTVLDGQTYLSPKAADIVVGRHVRGATGQHASAYSALTPRERQVLALVADGLSTRQIGERLGVSAKTIEVHRAHIMRKLNIRSIAELTKYAIREGLTTLDP